MNDVIRVCFAVSSLCNEGPVNVMYNIIQYMDFSKFEVSIITLIPEEVNTRIEDFRKLPVSIHQLAPDKHPSPITMFQAFRKEVIRINPDMVHSHCPRSFYFSCFLPKKYKRIYTIHIYPGLQQEILYGKAKGKIVNQLNHLFTRWMDQPIACAESVSMLYKKNKGLDIQAIPNGCSLPLWNVDLQQKQHLRKTLGLKEDIRYFIFIGRFSFEKNPKMLIETFHRLQNPKIGLIMLGTGPLWKKLSQCKDERILFPGFKTNVYDYLIASDYYISASDIEGLANTLLESMTVGLPMLLSDIPSHREVLSKMEKPTGFIFDHKNPTDLMEKINAIITTFDKDMAAMEIQRVFTKFYIARKMSESYQLAYSDLFFKNK